jgi:predicted oxidoreductase
VETIDQRRTGPVTADVVVVGAAAAGFGAALEAAARGARIVVIEAADQPGGTAATAGAGTCIAGSALQARRGIVDSPTRALEDWLAWGGPSVDEEWARRYLEASVPDLYERFEQVGVEWLEAHPREGNSVPRWHQPKGGGLAVMLALLRSAEQFPSIEWSCLTRARELITSGGAVTGVLADGPGGPIEFRAPSVVMATGGFNNNVDMVREHALAARSARRVLLGGGRVAKGEGHAILERVDAQFVNLDAVWMFPYGTPDYKDPKSNRGLAVRGLTGEIWVNEDGNRFHDETLRGGSTGTAALLAQPGGTCWSIVDSRIAGRLTIADPYYRRGSDPLPERLWEFLDHSPFVARGATLPGLAAELGMDATNLQAAVADSNAAILGGAEADPVTGKSLAGLTAIEEPPYYAIQLFPLARKNLGGVRTDLDCQVLDTDDRPIPGLFAAGEVAGMAGGRINGRAALEGTSFGPSFYSGLVAGRNVSA